MDFIRCTIALLFLFPFAFVCGGQESEPFQDGCCLSAAFPRPLKVSRQVIPRKHLLQALTCATREFGASESGHPADLRHDPRMIYVAYYYGQYMPEQGGKALTMAVYSEDGIHGMLYDIEWEGEKYFVTNGTDLLRGRRQWRVGEINGGLWTYSKLWYLAQEIGSRPRLRIPARSLMHHQPKSCTSVY